MQYVDNPPTMFGMRGMHRIFKLLAESTFVVC